MGVPLLAICRGFQELNVALGGTLVTEAQERPGSLDHRAPLGLPNDERFKLAHDVTFEPDSHLAELLGAGCVRVNSVHRQVIGKLAPRLIVEARAPDGTVEAVRVADAPASPTACNGIRNIGRRPMPPPARSSAPSATPRGSAPRAPAARGGVSHARTITTTIIMHGMRTKARISTRSSCASARSKRC